MPPPTHSRATKNQRPIASQDTTITDTTPANIIGERRTLAYAAFSQRWRGKADNDDAVLVQARIDQGRVCHSGFLETTQPILFALADGVSSQRNPRAASYQLLQLLLENFYATSNRHIHQSIDRIRHRYIQLGQEKRYRLMASTLVAASIKESEITILNVGDSRAYLIENGAATLLSRDHTHFQDMLDAGEITPEQAATAASI